MASRQTDPTLRSLLDPLIRELGISETARRAGLHRPDLSAWLNGRRLVSDDKLDRLAGVLGVRFRIVKK